MPRLYLAYGSNLSKQQMLRRCPDAEPVSAVQLTGWRLAFVGESTKRWGKGGVATLIGDKAATMQCALYRLNERDEAALDGFEGVASGHYRKLENILEYEGQPAFTYICRFADENPPSRNYLDTIKSGYIDWELPHVMLDQIEIQPA
jgi:hypothetical protein